MPQKRRSDAPQNSAKKTVKTVYVSNTANQPLKNVKTQKKETTNQPKKAVSSKSAKRQKKQKKVATKGPSVRVIHPISQETSTSFQLALLSPYRFPLNTDLIASQVARYSGVFFVVIGAIFTLLNMHLMFASQNESVFSGVTRSSLPATLVMINGTEVPREECFSAGSNYYNTPECELVRQEQEQQQQTITVEKPPAFFSVENQEPLIGMTPVHVTVPFANKVVLAAFNKQQLKMFPIGEMNIKTDLVWRAYWETREFPDGDYRLHATVFSPDFPEGYNQQDSRYYRVENVTVADGTTQIVTTGQTDIATTTTTSTSSTGSGSGSTSTTTTTVSTTDNHQISLSNSGGSTVSGKIEVKVVTDNADKVKIFIRHETATADKFLGSATRYSSDTWKYEWDTRPELNALYRIIAVVQYTDSHVADKYIRVTVDNSQTQTTTATTSTTTQSPTTTATTQIPQTTTTDAPLEPTISMSIPEPSPISGDTDVLVYVNGASVVEIYAQPKLSLTPIHAGPAEKKSDYEWRFKWYTFNMPNGEYYVFARVKHSNGISESKKQLIKIFNEQPKLTPEETTKLQEYKEATASTTPVITTTVTEPPKTTPTTYTLEPLQQEVEDIETFLKTTNITEDSEDTLRDVVDAYEEAIKPLLRKLEEAKRTGDSASVTAIQEELRRISRETTMTLSTLGDTGTVQKLTTEYLDRISDAYVERIERNERIIRERIGDAVTKDTDRDGVTDFDEVNLYHTNPFSADSDQDGFMDGIEIERGFDPRSDRPEANIAYESPKETGTVRDDIFVINTISTLTLPQEEIESGNLKTQALITGTGLPNSFVTLYIFSTPIVVTVRTDKDGGWSYILDKELDDGEHEIYVGVTDNAGRIVGKSNPFTFVKTAEAFSPIGAAAETPLLPDEPEPSLISVHALLAIASMALAALGLILVLLGLHVRHVKSETLAQPLVSQ